MKRELLNQSLLYCIVSLFVLAFVPLLGYLA